MLDNEMVVDSKTSAIDFSCQKTIRYLVLSRYIYMTTGVLLVAVGSFVRLEYNDYYELIPDLNYFVTGSCMLLGNFVIVIGFWNLYATMKESDKILFWSIPAANSIILLMFFQVLFGCVCAIKDLPGLKQQFARTIGSYGHDDYGLTRTWDKMQNDFSCCGVSNASDWLAVLNTQDSGDLPLSCCPISSGFTCNTTLAYPTGCANFMNWIASSAAPIAYISLISFFAQIYASHFLLTRVFLSQEEIRRNRVRKLYLSIDSNSQNQLEKSAFPNEPQEHGEKQIIGDYFKQRHQVPNKWQN